jgi:hypothetical protein
MTDQDQERQRQHWLAIAEQLGLDADSMASSSSGRMIDNEGEPAVGPDDAGDLDRDNPRQSGTSRGGAGEASVKSVSPPAEAPGDKNERESETALEPHELQDEAENREQSGRRRGRRSSKSTANVMKADRASAPRPPEWSDESERQRSTGRNRRKRSGDDAADSPQVEEAAGDEEDEAEVDDFSNWSVPSWNELIASLYRPEH